MNDSTLPPSARTVRTATTAPSSSKRRTRPRQKVGVRPGFGLHNWHQLLRSANDLAQRRGRPIGPISKAEIAKHNSVHDGWISLHGKVYNITPYLHYHPGGVDILEKCLGRDATALFEKYHRWVNIQGLIGPLLIGVLEEEKKADSDEIRIIPPALAQQTRSSRPAAPSGGDDEFAMPAPRPPKGAASSSLLPSTADAEENGADDDLNPWEEKSGA